MRRSTPPNAAAWKTFARASMFGPSSSSQDANSLGFGGEVDDGVNAVEMTEPIFVEFGKVGHDQFRIVGIGDAVDEDEVVDVGPSGAQLPTDVAVRPRDQHGTDFLVVVVFVVILVFIRLFVIVISEILGIKDIEATERSRFRFFAGFGSERSADSTPSGSWWVSSVVMGDLLAG